VDCVISSLDAACLGGGIETAGSIEAHACRVVWRVVGCSARRRFGPSLLHVVEPPYADPHVQWCGAGRGYPPGYPIRRCA
jgi:hypothetical protein